MNNNLPENLKKFRKDNNISQEQLAEELGVSRQAISKWESGTAYPEMEKIMQLCNKFNMSIDDLLYKDIHEIKGEEISKKNINKYIDDFLNFITDTINLFSNMNFKSKVKCLFEQIIISLILLIIFLIIGSLGNDVIYSLFYSVLPHKIYYITFGFLRSIYMIFAFVVSFAVLIHIFKTRYLNYYFKIKNECNNLKNETEDNKEENNENTNSGDVKSINKKNKILFRKNENKIIIRDPKHSEYRFINGLFKIIILSVKFFALLALIFLCIILVGLFAGSVMSFAIAKTGIFFLGLLFSLLSLGIIDIILILLLINFIFDRKNDKKKMIWSFIISVIILGISCGFVFIGSLKFDFIDNENNDLIITKNIEFDMNDNLFFNHDNEIEYIEKDINDIKIEYKTNEMCKLKYKKSKDDGIFIWSDCSNPMEIIRQFIKKLNENKIVNISNEITDIKVYASKENIEKINNNYKKYLEYESNNQDIIDSYEREILNYKNQIEKYTEQEDEYKNKIEEYKDEVISLKEELKDYKNNKE